MSASTIAIVEDVTGHPATSITEIVERTGLAQSLVSGAVAQLGHAEVFIVEQDPTDRRRTQVSMNPKRRSEDFTDRASRSIEHALRGIVPDATDARMSSIQRALDRLAKELLHNDQSPAPSSHQRRAR